MLKTCKVHGSIKIYIHLTNLKSQVTETLFWFFLLPVRKVPALLALGNMLVVRHAGLKVKLRSLR